VSNRPRPDHASRERRIIEGTERNAHWANLTPAQKINELDRRLGKGVGAKRQREKLS
jgi:hypothetical protein